METLGQFLKREREFREISLEKLSRMTKISPATLRSIETDQFGALPRGSYFKGYLGAYALHLDLQVEDLLNRYPNLSLEPKGGEDPFKKFRRFDTGKQVILVIIFLTIVITLATFLSSR